MTEDVSKGEDGNQGDHNDYLASIKDDLFDIIGDSIQTGKPSGYDLKRNMLTLPLIYILSRKNSI